VGPDRGLEHIFGDLVPAKNRGWSLSEYAVKAFILPELGPPQQGWFEIVPNITDWPRRLRFNRAATVSWIQTAYTV